jgi:hypothetical protein
MTEFRLERCKKCGKNKVVIIENKRPQPKEFTQKIDEHCDCSESLIVEGQKMTGKKREKRKKSLIGLTMKGWKEDFSWNSKKAALVEITKRKGDWIAIDTVKVKVTVEEL